MWYRGGAMVSNGKIWQMGMVVENEEAQGDSAGEYLGDDAGGRDRE